MGLPDARVGDNHTCPMVDPGPKPHVGGGIQPPCSTNTKSNSKPTARGTDRATCQGPPDFIVTGSATVKVNSKPVARSTDKTMHGGVIVAGSANVHIGGGTTGVTLGNVAAGIAACQRAAQGRTSGNSQQSYQNCGVESSRQVIQEATGSNVTEDQLLDRAMNNNWADQEPARADSGGSTASQTESLLNDRGVPNTTQPQNMANVQQGVAEGRGVITGHDAGALWGTADSGGHAVLVTGIEYDANGQPQTVYINDTGRSANNCGNAVPANQFENSFIPGDSINVTDDPIW